MEIFKLLIKKWSTLKEIVYTLQIPYNATVTFQKQNLTLSDVYGRWISMQLHLRKCSFKSSYKTGLAGSLLDAMVKRNERIFNNPLMVCALYLDPRYRMVVIKCSEKTQQAMDNLIKIWHRLRALHENDHPAETETINISTDSLSFEFDEESELKQLLQSGNPMSAQSQSKSQARTQTLTNDDIELELELFQPDVIPFKSSILDFWETAKEEHGSLYELASVIFSIPPTEVQIERDFSSLDFIFRNRRGSLGQSKLEDIFLIHLNKDLFFTVNNEDIQEMYKKLHH